MPHLPAREAPNGEHAALPGTGDLAALGAALAARVPDAGPITPLRWLDAGFSSLVVETPAGVVWRIARHAAAGAAYQRERRLLPALAPLLPVAVPDPRWYLAPDATLPFGALGAPRLPGVPLDPAHATGSQTTALAAELAHAMLALHSFPPERAVDLGVPLLSDARPGWRALRDATLPELRRRLSPAERARLRAYWDAASADALAQVERPVLVHGDLWYGNLLVDPRTGRLTALLDFEAAVVGDLAQDLATLLHLGPAFTTEVLAAYRAAGGRTGARFPERVRRHWELRELSGVRLALTLGDKGELDEALAKLRAGPLFHPPDWRWLGD